MSELGLDNLIKEKLIQLHGKIETIKQIKQAKGEDFNLFSILEMERLEVETHSKFIYELINPRGSHYQGELYLRLFLGEALGLNDFGEIKNVERESFTANNRRIDFAIETDKYQIGIEMKIDAGDQDHQLKDYYDELAKRAKSKREVKLYYLTLDGGEASDESDGDNKDKYARISFRDNIARWIEVCIEKSVMLPSIRESLVQYGNLIKKIIGQTTKEVQMEVEKIVNTPQMAEAATLMAQNIGKAWAKREALFWKKLIDELQDDEYMTNKKWKILTDKDYKNPDETEFFFEGKLIDDIDIISVKICDTRESVKSDYVGISLEQDRDEYEIEFSIYERNDQDGIYCQLDSAGEFIDDLARELSLKYIKGEDKFSPLGIKVNFYGKRVSEPTYELFDDKKLEEFVKETKDAIIGKLEIIDSF